MSTPPRKLDHIRIVLDSPIEYSNTTTMLEHIRFIPSAIHELDFESIDISTRFLDKKLSAPLIITGMTGGHEIAAKINCAIARAAEEIGVAMGVGSQRAAIEDSSLSHTFRIARECAPSIPIIANLGLPQIAKGYGIEEVQKAINMIDADALAIHLNIAQEIFQPEGDISFSNSITKLSEIVLGLGIPIIVKETGQGIDMETAYLLYQNGIRFFDVAGAGGTSWILVEGYRSKESNTSLYESSKSFSSWGLSTLLSLVETRWAAPSSCIIASGGIRTGHDAAKAIAFGADLAGVALPVLKAYAQKGLEGVKSFLERIIFEIKATLFVTGSRNLNELRRRPIIISQKLIEITSQREIDINLYLSGARLFKNHGEACNRSMY